MCYVLLQNMIVLCFTTEHVLCFTTEHVLCFTTEHVLCFTTEHVLCFTTEHGFTGMYLSGEAHAGPLKYVLVIS